MPILSFRQRSAALALGLLYPVWVLISSPVIFGVQWEGFLAFVVPMMIFGAALPAMIGLAALWCIWGPVRLAVRFAVVVGVTAALNVVWLVGFLIATVMARPDQRPIFGDDLLLGNAIFLLALPGIVAAAAVGPWLLRLLFSFRLVHLHDEPATRKQGSFSIASVMAVTALVAGVMAASRMSLTIQDGAPESDQMLTLAAFWAGAAGVSLVSLVPAALFILWPRKWATVFALVVAYYLTATVFVACLIGANDGSAFFFPLLLLIFTLALILPLLYARWIGYRLVRGA